MATECVTLNYNGNYGYVEYTEESKGLAICIPNSPEKEQEVEKFLTTPQTMDIPSKDSIREFETVTLTGTDNVRVFGIVLTRLWVNTGVLVEWSMPPRAVEEL